MLATSSLINKFQLFIFQVEICCALLKRKEFIYMFFFRKTVDIDIFKVRMNSSSNWYVWFLAKISKTDAA